MPAKLALGESTAQWTPFTVEINQTIKHTEKLGSSKMCLLSELGTWGFLKQPLRKENDLLHKINRKHPALYAAKYNTLNFLPGWEWKKNYGDVEIWAHFYHPVYCTKLRCSTGPLYKIKVQHWSCEGTILNSDFPTPRVIWFSKIHYSVHEVLTYKLYDESGQFI